MRFVAEKEGMLKRFDREKDGLKARLNLMRYFAAVGRQARLEAYGLEN